MRKHVIFLFGVSVEYLLSICWVSVAYLLSICWVSVEYLLNICWASVEYLLNICWVSVEYLLSICWVSVEYLLSICWVSFEYLLCICWSRWKNKRGTSLIEQLLCHTWALCRIKLLEFDNSLETQPLEVTFGSRLTCYKYSPWKPDTLRSPAGLDPHAYKDL